MDDVNQHRERESVLSMHVRGGVSDYHVGPAQPPAAVAVSDTREKRHVRGARPPLSIATGISMIHIIYSRQGIAVDCAPRDL